MPSSAPYPLWGWTPQVRVLLSVFALAGALDLIIIGSGRGGGTPPSPSLVVDLNTAPPQVLTVLPRLGPVLTGRIVTARHEVPFRSLEDLDVRVKGIGPSTVAALRPYVRTAVRVTHR